MTKTIKLEGRVFVTFNLRAATGLHIGGSDAGIEIGGVDKTVIRDVLTNQPYIPGSSLKGKLRSLLEKYAGLPQNRNIGQAHIHSCADAASYAACAICLIFGVPGEENFSTPTRVVVRDVHLEKESARRLENLARTDMPYTEVKTEVAIDRVTSKANPRQMERVPAGSIFGPAELVYSIYSGDAGDPSRDVANLATLIEGLQLLEDDYLGGQGSRGSGKVRLEQIQVTARKRTLDAPHAVGKSTYPTLADLAEDTPQILTAIRKTLALT